MPPAKRQSGPLLSERGVLAAITAFWIVIGGVSWILEYVLSFSDPAGPFTLGRAAARWVYAGLWWLASVLGFWLSDAVTVWSWRQYPKMVFHAVAGALVAVAWSASAYYINLAVIPGWRPEGVARMINTTGMMTWFIYTGLVCLAHAVIHAREYQTREMKALEAAKLATEAELHALKMQLQPHFLFNALNSVSALMHKDVRAASEMLALVGEMLERSLRRVRAQEVTLAEEIRTAELFLQIEQVRFQDRLSVTWNVDPQVRSALVPHMLLQPIIDNALRHGIRAHAGPGRIEISASRNGQHLDLELWDNGPGPSRGTADSGFGIGLSVTRERLTKLYGQSHSFSLSDAPEGGALVRISMPLRPADEQLSQEVTDVHAHPDGRR